MFNYIRDNLNRDSEVVDHDRHGHGTCVTSHVVSLVQHSTSQQVHTLLTAGGCDGLPKTVVDGYS